MSKTMISLIIGVLGLCAIVAGQVLLKREVLPEGPVVSIAGGLLLYLGWRFKVGTKPWRARFQEMLNFITNWYTESKRDSLTPEERKSSMVLLSIPFLAMAFAAVSVHLLSDGRLQGSHRYSLENLGPPLILALIAAVFLWFSIRFDPGTNLLSEAPKDERVSSRKKELLIVLGVTAVAAWFRLYDIGRLPTGCWLDEAEYGLAAQRILHTEWRPIFIDWKHIQNPAFFIWQIAGSFKLFGETVIGIRLVTMITGILCVPIFYVLSRQMMGILPAFAGSFILASMRWHITMSRIGMWCIQTVLFEILAFLFLWRALRTRSLWNFAASGLFLGIGIHTYTASRLVVVVFVAFFLYLLVRQTWHFVRKTETYDNLTSPWSFKVFGGVLITGLVSAAVVLPLVLSAGDALWKRAGQTNIYKFLPRGVTGLDIFLEPKFWTSVMKHVLMFHYVGDPNGRHNIPGWALLEPIVGTLFLLGVILALIRLWDSRGILALILLGVMLQAGIWSVPFEAPQALRSLGAIPAVVLLSALTVEYYWGLIRASGIAIAKFYFRVGLGVILLASATISYWQYFIEGPKDQYVWAGHSTVDAHIGKILRKLKNRRNVEAWCVKPLYNSSTLEFVSGGSKYDNWVAYDRGLPLTKIPSKTILLFMKTAKVYNFVARIYPDAKVERLTGPNHSIVLYIFRITPRDVEETFGMTNAGKATLWLPRASNRDITIRLNGLGRVYLDGKRFITGPMERTTTLPRKTLLELIGGKPEDLEISDGILIKNRLQDSRDVSRRERARIGRESRKSRVNKSRLERKKSAQNSKK